MKSKTSSVLFFTTIISVILGGIFGYHLPEIMLSVSFIGQLFINALQIVVIPVVVVSIIIGIAGLGDIKKINRSVGKTILYFISTSAAAIGIGLVLVYLIQPGGSLSPDGAFIPPETMQLKSFSFSGMIASLLPENLFKASFGGQILGLIIFSIFFGIVLANSGTKRKIVIDFLQVIHTSLSKLVVLLLIIAPIGLFSLMGTITAWNFSSISNIAGNLFIFSLTLIIAFLLHAFIILPVTLKLFTNHSPFIYLRNSIPAISTALGTASSIATLPVTYDCVVEKNKIDNRAGALTLPLGAAINMNGTALYLVVASIFIAQVFQISLSPIQIILILGASLIVSIGSSVIPHTSVITLAIILNIADFPFEAYAGIGLIVAVDWFFDRWRTAVNVWSDAVGAAVIGNSFDFKTVRVNRTHSTGRKQVVSRSYKDRPRQSVRKTRDDKQPQIVRKGRENKFKDSKVGKTGGPRTLSRKPSYRQKVKEPSLRTNINKNKHQRPSPFKMPPIPYHVLENELHPKNETNDFISNPNPSQKPTGSNNKSYASGNNISLDTIERERVKIATQLADMKASEKKKTTSPRSESKPDSGFEVETSTGIIKKENNSPDIKYSGDNKVTTTKKIPKKLSGLDIDKSIDEKVTESNLATGTDKKEYGRSKSRRYSKSENNSSAKKEAKVTSSEKPEYSSENISFGRSKRKK